MNLDHLRAGLTDLAEEARPADLHARALSTSRRIGRTRLALVAAATAAIVGVTSAGLALHRDDRALPDVTTTPTLPAGATSAVYTAALEGYGNMAVWDGNGVRSLYFRDYPVGRYSGDELRESVAVSPDGTYLSWFSSSGLHLSPVGGKDMVVLNRQDGDFHVSGGCSAPAWASDSSRLLTTTWWRNSAEIGWFAVDGGAFTASDHGILRQACDVYINGDWAVFTSSPSLGILETQVRNLRTGETRTIPGSSGGRRDFEVTSVSPDGERITARLIDNDPERSTPPPRTLEADMVFDTRTGDALPFSAASDGAPARQLFFTPSGNLVARLAEADRSWLAIFAPDGRLISRSEEPADVRDMVLLRLAAP